MSKEKLKHIFVLIGIVFFTLSSIVPCAAEKSYAAQDIKLSDYNITGAGTAIDPYIITISGENNLLREEDINKMLEKAPEAIWLVKHEKGGVLDYTMRFSSNNVQTVNPPFSLDVNTWQDREGTLQVQIKENDSEYVPVTLTLELSGYKGFENGNVVSVSGSMRMRVPVKEGKLELPLEHGGDYYITADGYEPLQIQEDSNSQETESSGYWDKPNEQGEAISDEYIHAGSDILPFYYDFSKSGETVVDGASFNELKNNGQSRLFLYKDKSNKILWSYLVESKRISKVSNKKMFDFDTEFDNGNIKIAEKDDFPCKMKACIYVGDKYHNAQIINIKGNGIDTSSIVDRGYIYFYIEKGGTYKTTPTGETVSGRTVDDAKLVSSTSRDNMYTTQNYKGEKPYGTKDEPLTILGKLDDFFWASWRSINTVAGYSSDMNATEASYDPAKIMNVSIEYRSPSTGKLIASITIDGSQWRMTPENMKGPYYLDYKLNPSKEVIEKTLKSHSLYIGKYADRRKEAAETLTAISENPNSVLFLMSRTREFAGAINYKIDMSNYYKSGDILHFKYLLGSCNGDLYHGKAQSNAELLTQESTYSRYDADYVVDSQGYITFPLYTGGFFVFTKTGETQEIADGWAPGNGNGSSGNGNKASAPVVKEEKIYMDEEVNDKKETETGVLTDMRVKEQLKEANYKKELGNLTVEGYLNNPNVDLNAEELLKSEGQKAYYKIQLIKESGFSYKMEDGEYLKVTCDLGSGYSIYDEDLLYVKEIKNAEITAEVFAADSKIDEKGNMRLNFHTTHLGEFAVFKADSKEELAKAISLKQEYTSEATTLLAEQSLKRKDSAKTIKLLLIVTLLVCSLLILITEVKRRKRN
ncbi:hypothetical protein [Anaerovorax odorimutans]|uniref:hypothetical protein n=1 Tax=Anaerovorax odorimutans TaxID=109327 RepID=UPI000426C3B9|nr:hypothetical protein [Anaerovorax odorimutans]